MQQATVNLLRRHGRAAGDAAAGLVAATAVDRHHRADSTITTPAAGTTVAGGTAVTVTGTATDTGGGVVGGVEVSTDGGTTWHPATGRDATGRYTWTPAAPGRVDGAQPRRRRQRQPRDARRRRHRHRVTCPCSIWPDRPCPRTRPRTTPAPVELGVKFRADIDGYITGVRFYKGTANTGTHIGNLWTTTGTLLATATFTGETAVGLAAGQLRQPRSPSPPNTDLRRLVPRRHGHYADDRGYFATGRPTPRRCTRPRAGAGGANGVYRYGAAARSRPRPTARELLGRRRLHTTDDLAADGAVAERRRPRRDRAEHRAVDRDVHEAGPAGVVGRARAQGPGQQRRPRNAHLQRGDEHRDAHATRPLTRAPPTPRP